MAKQAAFQYVLTVLIFSIAFFLASSGVSARDLPDKAQSLRDSKDHLDGYGRGSGGVYSPYIGGGGYPYGGIGRGYGYGYGRGRRGGYGYGGGRGYPGFGGFGGFPQPGIGGIGPFLPPRFGFGN